MKNELELKAFKKQIKKDEKKFKKKTNTSWVIKVTLSAFLISLLFSFSAETVIPNTNILVGIIIVMTVIAIGVLFDMIGIAVASASAVPFHSMCAKKVQGAKVAVMMIKHADKVSSFCNDVIGDICGIISGSAGVIIAASLARIYDVNTFALTLLITSLIAALTIGGKAMGKSLAINRSDTILYEFAKAISYIYDYKNK